MGNIAAIIMFIEINSGKNELRTAPTYDPPIMSFKNSDWKTSRPNAKPKAYSVTRSTHIGVPTAAVMTAAMMIPVASPATQWMVDPSACFHIGLTNSSCVPGAGSRQEST